MKRKQRGEAAIITLLLLAGLMVVGRAEMPKLDFSQQATNEPVYHNYNGGFTK